MTVNKDYLEVEKIREEIRTELARQHDWDQQERHWQRMQEHWAHEQKMTRTRIWLGGGALIATFTGLLVKFL